MFKKIFFLFFFTYLFFITTNNSIAVDSCDSSQCDSGSEKYQQCLEDVRDFCSKQKSTLSNQIKLLDSQYQITLSKITQTEKAIATLEKEITGLNVEIGKLEKEINQLSATYISQIIQSYKLQKKYPAFAYLLSDNLNTFLEQNQYASAIQANSKQNLIDRETVRYNYDQQKTLKEEKQIELETLQKNLASQKITLVNQKATKDQLLKITEAQYSAILSKLSSFANTSATCLSKSPGGGSDGFYFSQIDPSWCNQKPAGTEGCIVSGTNKPCTIGNIGCYITSTAMVLKKLGINTNPSTYAADISHIESSADMKPIETPSGYNYCRISSSSKSSSSLHNIIDHELSSNRYVIAQVPLSPYHFVVLISGSNGTYKMHDPWRGSDLGFNGYYSYIVSIRLVTPESCP